MGLTERPPNSAFTPAPQLSKDGIRLTADACCMGFVNLDCDRRFRRLPASAARSCLSRSSESNSMNENDLCVQYGCGNCAPEGWLNFDCSPTLRLQRLPVAGNLFRAVARTKFPASVRYGDIVSGLPIAAESAGAVYCSHVLEHLAMNDLHIAITNTLRILRPDGVFRMVLPDLRLIATQYVRDPGPDASLTFMRDTGLGVESRARGLVSFARHWFGNANHLWMWDYESLSAALVAAGFRKPRRAAFNDSAEPRFTAVENADRWHHALGIECIR